VTQSAAHNILEKNAIEKRSGNRIAVSIAFFAAFGNTKDKHKQSSHHRDQSLQQQQSGFLS
jgi:hypothetical protein